MHTTIHVEGFIEIARFSYGQLLSVDVDKHHDGSPSKGSLRYKSVEHWASHK